MIKAAAGHALKIDHAIYVVDEPTKTYTFLRRNLAGDSRMPRERTQQAPSRRLGIGDGRPPCPLNAAHMMMFDESELISTRIIRFLERDEVEGAGVETPVASSQENASSGRAIMMQKPLDAAIESMQRALKSNGAVLPTRRGDR